MFRPHLLSYLIHLVLFSSLGLQAQHERGILTLEEVLSRADFSAESLVKDVLEHRPDHPRLFVTDATWERLRKNKNRTPWDKELQDMRRNVRARISGIDFSEKYEVKPGNTMSSLRPVGDLIAATAFLYRVDESPEWYEANQKLINYVLNIPVWGYPRLPNRSLAANHIMNGLALAYDWLYDDLPKTQIEDIRNALLDRAPSVIDDRPRRNYQNNHLSLHLQSMMAVGIVLADADSPIPGGLLEYSVRHGEVLFYALSHSDGFLASEGTPYWQYNLMALVPMAVMAKEDLGIDWFSNNRGFQKASAYAAAMMLPLDYRKFEDGRAVETLITFGDGPRIDWYQYQSYMPRLAGEYQDGLAQWVAQDTRETLSRHNSPLRFLGMIWFDPELKPTPPAESLDNVVYFDEQGILVWRSDWSGGESMLAFKAGPPAGHFGNEFFDYNPATSHGQPDAGTLVIHADGVWVLVPPGYVEKDTKYTNSILVNGVGQIGSGKTWFHDNEYFQKKLAPGITSVVNVGNRVKVVANLTEAYPVEAKVECITRSVTIIDDRTWLIHDAVTLDEPGEINLLFHLEVDAELQGEAEARVIQGNVETLFETVVVSREGTVGVLYDLKAQQIPSRHNPKEVLGEIPLLRVSSKITANQADYYTLIQNRSNAQPIWHIQVNDGGVVEVTKNGLFTE